MVGEGDRGEYRPQGLRADAARHHPAEVRQGETIEVVGAKAVERHQHEGRLRKVLGTIDAAASR